MALETEDKELDHATVLKGVSAVFDDETRGRYLVAVFDTEVVGSLLLTYEWSDWRNGWFWWIQSVYVEPAHRRLGAFASMYSNIISDAGDRPDVSGVRLYVEDDNVPAQGVYEAVGMGHAGYQVYEVDFVLG